MTWTLAFMPEWHTGQFLTVDPHIVHRHRCLHGSNSTIDSLSPHLRHILAAVSLSSGAAVVRRRSSSSSLLLLLLLPQLDSASSSGIGGAAARRWSSAATATWARTCSRLLRREFAVASFVWASSRQIWFSTQRVFTRSCNAQFIFPILWISSSFSFSFLAMASWIPVTNVLDCLALCFSSSILTFSVCSETRSIRFKIEDEGGNLIN